MNQGAVNRTRKSVQRNVRSKRTVTSPREVHGSVEHIKPEERLVQPTESSNSSSCQLTSEMTSASFSTGTSDPHLKDTSNKRTDTAVVNSDIETKASNVDFSCAGLPDNSDDTNIDLDEQAILTYVLLYHFCSICLCQVHQPRRDRGKTFVHLDSRDRDHNPATSYHRHFIYECLFELTYRTVWYGVVDHSDLSVNLLTNDNTAH